MGGGLIAPATSTTQKFTNWFTKIETDTAPPPISHRVKK